MDYYPLHSNERALMRSKMISIAHRVNLFLA